MDSLQIDNILYCIVFLTWVVSEGVEETKGKEGFIVRLAAVQRVEDLTQVWSETTVCSKSHSRIK